MRWVMRHGGLVMLLCSFPTVRTDAGLADLQVHDCEITVHVQPWHEYPWLTVMMLCQELEPPIEYTVYAAPQIHMHIANNERIWLEAVARAFHGSSALQTLLRSSNAVATLCGMRAPNGKPIWQCEPGKAFVDPQTLLIVSSAAQVRQSASQRGVQPKKLPLRKYLQFLGNFWNLSRPILACKFCEIPGGRRVLEGAELPQSFQQAGISKVIPAALIMWTPICLHHLSTHSKARLPKHKQATKEQQRKATKYLHEQIVGLENIVSKIRLANNTHFVVISYATLLSWQPHRLVKYLPLTFLPQLSDLVPTYAAPERRSKTHQNIVAFGRRHPPSNSCGFEVSRGKHYCNFNGTLLSQEYKLLSTPWKKCMHAATNLLYNMSIGI